ncbi:D(1A) dopamine receptor-like [Amphiura filiformis]|uniref:D(1A) dopamine receptor-like n=1 Tax=Amphiura filiformis TaxID=82378 RepID=UPI003B226144
MDMTTELLSTENATSDRLEVDIGFAIFLPIFILVTTVMNLGTIIAFWKMPSLREKPSELLILNLACSDIITGVFVLPLASPLYIIPNQWPFGEIGCAIWIFSVDISLHGTLFALSTISADRFLLVYLEYPQYIKNVTRKGVYKVIAAGWIFTLITAVIEMACWEKAKGLNDVAGGIDYSKICLSPPRRVRSFALSFFFVLYVCPVILVCTLSVAFLYQLRLRLKKTTAMTHELKESSNARGNTATCTSHSSDTTERSTEVSSAVSSAPNEKPSSQQVATLPNRKTGSEANVRNRYIKPGITLIGLVSAMAICMLPYIFYVFYSDIAAAHGECDNCSNPDLIYGLILMQFCNACLDPFIYVLTRRRVRKYYQTCCKRQSAY